MNENLTLLILAAGMGSRFGGLKQIEPIGYNGEFIIDYSVYDAIKAGFNKIIFLIKEENYELFKKTIGSRVEPYINVEYCFQKNNNIPIGINLPDTRIKPLGTAHAILCCKDKIKEPFAIINADDFYGRDAFFKASEFLKEVDVTKSNYGMIGYLVKNTITENGSVKRGICKINKNYLTEIKECNIIKMKNNIIATPLDTNDSFIIDENTVVSMNMLLFTPTIMNYIEKNFKSFLEKNLSKIETCEYLIPEVLMKSLNDKYSSVKVFQTSDSWYGVTYKEDLPFVKESLQKLVDNGIYPNNLWKKNNHNN